MGRVELLQSRASSAGGEGSERSPHQCPWWPVQRRREAGCSATSPGFSPGIADTQLALDAVAIDQGGDEAIQLVCHGAQDGLPGAR